MNKDCQHTNPQPQPFTWTKSIITCSAIVLITISAYLATIFIQPLLVPLAFLAPNLFRIAHDVFVRSWMQLTEIIICSFMGVKIRHFGDEFLLTPSRQFETSLLLMNHRTRLDWLFAWGLGDQIQRTKIVLKDSLAIIPGAGWAMQCASFLFLKRRLATDRDRIELATNYLSQTTGQYQGTDLCENTLSLSNRFAAKNNLPPTQYTLYPRYFGFINLVNNMRKAGLSYIYDITVAYPDRLPSPESNLFRGGIPSEVHYLVHRYSLEDVLDELVDNYQSDDANRAQIDSKLSSWLAVRWRDKERLLEDYYNGDRSFAESDNNSTSPCRSQSLIFNPDSSHKKRLNLLGWTILLFWFLTLPYCVYLLATSHLVRIVTLLIQLFYLYVTFRTDGFHSIIARWKLGCLSNT